MHWGGGHLICQLQLFAALANSCSSPLRHACFYSKRPIVLSFLLEPTVLLFCTTVYLVPPPRHLYLHRVTCTSTASPVPPPRHMYLHHVTCTSTASPVPTPRRQVLQCQADGRESGSLFSTLNHTQTAFGRRVLAGWVRQPLLSPEDIGARQVGAVCG